jgi:type IV secretion system protein VirD4
VSYADRRELEDEIIRRHAACEDVPGDAEADAAVSGGILHTPVQEPEHQAAPKPKAPVRV